MFSYSKTKRNQRCRWLQPSTPTFVQKKFAVDWEISTKTAQRDIDFLRDRMGAPIEYDALKRGYYYTEPTFMLPAVQMNEGELAALLMGSKMLEAFQGTPMAEKLTSVFEKLSSLLPDNITVRPDELFTRFSFTAPPAMPVSSNVWKKVVQGLETGRMLEIAYKNWRGEMTYRVAPVHLANLQGDWYLFVRFNSAKRLRMKYCRDSGTRNRRSNHSKTGGWNSALRPKATLKSTCWSPAYSGYRQPKTFSVRQNPKLQGVYACGFRAPPLNT